MSQTQDNVPEQSPMHDVIANMIVGSGQIAFALGVSRTTVVRMANEGEIGHAFRTPAGAFRFRVKHLAEYLERAAQAH